MLDEVLLYDHSDSPFCLKARICLQVKEVPFRRVTVTVGRRRELRRVNPLGKVPVLVHGSDVVPDSSAIARYLETRYPTPALIPSDAAARAYAALLEEWADEALYFVVMAFKWLNPKNREAARANTVTELEAGVLRPFVTRHLFRTIGKRYRLWGYTAAQLPELETRMRENLATLEALLAGKPYLLGRTPTLADVAVFSQLSCMERYVEGRFLDDVAEVRAWIERLAAAPPIAAALS